MCNNNLRDGGISVSDSFPDVYKRTLLRSYLKYNNTQIYALLIFICYAICFLFPTKRHIVDTWYLYLKLPIKQNVINLPLLIAFTIYLEKRKFFHHCHHNAPVLYFFCVCILWPLLFYIFFFFTLLPCSFDGVYHFRKWNKGCEMK